MIRFGVDGYCILDDVGISLDLMCVLFLFTSYWLAPIGRSLGIKSTRPKKASAQPALEAAYHVQSRLNHKTVSVCCPAADHDRAVLLCSR